MSSYVTQPAKEKAAYVATLEPVAGAAVTETGWVAAKDFCNYLAKIQSGLVGTSVDAKIQQATDNTGTGAKDVTVDNAGVTNLAITQLVAAGTALINFSQQDLDYNNGFDFVNVELTTVGATTVAGVDLLALDPIYDPVSRGSFVDEVVG